MRRVFRAGLWLVCLTWADIRAGASSEGAPVAGAGTEVSPVPAEKVVSEVQAVLRRLYYTPREELGPERLRELVSLADNVRVAEIRQRKGKNEFKVVRFLKRKPGIRPRNIKGFFSPTAYYSSKFVLFFHVHLRDGESSIGNVRFVSLERPHSIKLNDGGTRREFSLEEFAAKPGKASEDKSPRMKP